MHFSYTERATFKEEFPGDNYKRVDKIVDFKEDKQYRKILDRFCMIEQPMKKNCFSLFIYW